MACQSDQLQQSSESEGSLPTLPRALIKYPSNVLGSAKKTSNCVENWSKIRSQLATVSALVNWISIRRRDRQAADVLASGAQ